MELLFAAVLIPFYGRSPPVYPSPVANGTSSGAWAAAYARARALVAQMTTEEKVNVTHGWPGTCVGNTGAVPRLQLPSLCFADGPDGIRGQEFVSAFPAGIHVGATWDKELMYRYGKALGHEYLAKGINVALGPDAGVIATPKHWILNEQEFRRRESAMGEAVSSNVDDRTLHELYVFPFMDALRQGAGSVMCSYQRVNHSYGCQNSKLLNGILKTELGFEGFVVSDWDAQHSGVASANAGLDVVMPGVGYWGPRLVEAVNNGSVSEVRINDMAVRLLAAWHLLHQENIFPPPEVHSNLHKHFPIDAQADHATLIRNIGAAGTVLVKNLNGALPLQRPRFLCVYGYDAVVKAAPWENPDRFGGGYDVNSGWNTMNGTLISGGGSGSTTPPYVVSPFQAIQERIAKDRGVLRWDFSSANPSATYVNADACLVFVNAYASESFDRPSLTDAFSDSLISNVAAKCPNTIVVIHSAGIRVVDPWIDHPNITAVVFAGLPGQESGHSLVDVLYGDINPSGRLPYTVARKETDYGRLLNSSVSLDVFPDDDFSEGVYIDYRAFDRDGIVPRFEFGFGLSYTTFEYKTLAVSLARASDTAEYPDAKISVVQGGHPSLWEVVAVASCSISNTGIVDGTEVVQLYLGIPGSDSPVRQLRGFVRIGPLAPGETRLAVFELTRRDLSVWDVVGQQWRLPRGQYNIWVGASSRDLRLKTRLTIP
ncbi:beta-glucosidase 1 [Coniochaeta sp. PMI_546]|nr:beta-glucosidase 1 [Coniochaeta sp. PMI_546]